MVAAMGTPPRSTTFERTCSAPHSSRCKRALHSIAHLEPSIVRELAEDCAQEALTRIVQGLHAFRGDSQFTTWAYAVAVNTAFATVRRQRPAYARNPADEGVEAR